MDPNTTLADVRQLAQLVREDGLLPEALQQHAVRLGERFAELDEWLTQGGHVPGDWELSSRATLRLALTDQLQRLLEPVGWPEPQP